MPNNRIDPNHKDKDAIVQQLRVFGANVLADRDAAGLTQGQLAAMTPPLDRAAVSKIECGEQAPNPVTVKRFCAALGVTREHLLRGIGPQDSALRPLSEEELKRSTPAEIFGANLEWAMERKGMTQEDLAGNRWVDRTTISRLQKGRGEPNIRTILKLAYKLDTSPGALAHGT